MSDSSGNWTDRCCGGSFFSCTKLFLTLVLGLSTLLLPCVMYWQGFERFLEAGAAAVLCSSSGLAALAATFWQSRQQQPLVGLLLAMAIRMIPPLVVCLLMAVQSDAGEYIGFVCYLLLYYLTTLAIETYISIKLVDKAGR